MTTGPTADDLIDDFTERLCEQVRQKASSLPRTYGFEYEFLPQTILDQSDLLRVTDYLKGGGFAPDGEYLRHTDGTVVTFEPGGQIEYHSPPLTAEDTEAFYRSLAVIETTNQAIGEELGIVYIGTGYMPGRADAPLCLDSPRYHKLHDRLSRSGTRGREMMKGTASVHLHVVIRNYRELIPIYIHMARYMRPSRTFGMGPERRDIWDHTDPGRCGLPYENITEKSPPRALTRELVRVAVRAEVLGEDVPFWQGSDCSYEQFLWHMTTMFTDIRLNIKGPTLELRTPDSVPPAVFESMWEQFIRQLSRLFDERSPV